MRLSVGRAGAAVAPTSITGTTMTRPSWTRTARRCGRCSTADRCGRCAPDPRRTRPCSPRSRSTRHRSRDSGRSPCCGSPRTARRSRWSPGPGGHRDGRPGRAAARSSGRCGCCAPAPRRRRSTGVLDVTWSQTDRLVGRRDRARPSGADRLGRRARPRRRPHDQPHAAGDRAWRRRRTARRSSSTRADCGRCPRTAATSGARCRAARTPRCPRIRGRYLRPHRHRDRRGVLHTATSRDAGCPQAAPRRWPPPSREPRRHAPRDSCGPWSTCCSRPPAAAATRPSRPAPRCAGPAWPRCAVRCRPPNGPTSRPRWRSRPTPGRPGAPSSPTRSAAGGTSPSRWPPRSATRWPASARAECLLVPAPSRAAAARARGGDHMLRIAHRLARDGHGHVVRAFTLGRRARDSVGLDAAARAANLDAHLRLRPGALAGLPREASGRAPRRRAHHRRHRGRLRPGPRRGRAAGGSRAGRDRRRGRRAPGCRVRDRHTRRPCRGRRAHPGGRAPGRTITYRAHSSRRAVPSTREPPTRHLPDTRRSR